MKYENDGDYGLIFKRLIDGEIEDLVYFFICPAKQEKKFYGINLVVIFLFKIRRFEKIRKKIILIKGV